MVGWSNGRMVEWSNCGIVRSISNHVVFRSVSQCFTVFHSVPQCFAEFRSVTQCFTVLPQWLKD
eukprot:6019024-Lingulodinium_polyedra.AAC.1